MNTYVYIYMYYINAHCQLLLVFSCFFLLFQREGSTPLQNVQHVAWVFATAPPKRAGISIFLGLYDETDVVMRNRDGFLDAWGEGDCGRNIRVPCSFDLLQV